MLFSRRMWNRGWLALAWAAWFLAGWADLVLGAEKPLEKVVLALKWQHQFQFAGYYAAVKQGYYAGEGLEVELATPQDNVFAVESVLSGRAQYGVTAADLVHARTSGKPVVALASIFQHSPIMLLSRRDRNLVYLADYIGKTVMCDEDDVLEIKAMFLKEGIDPSLIRFIPHRWSVEPLIQGEVDASVDYITNEPFQLRFRGINPRIIQPIDYGIDFYGDTLFTTEEEVRQHPERAEAFRRASLRGWEYAMGHVNEMVDLILEMPGVKERGKTREILFDEAEQSAQLIQSQLVEMGHMNPARWERIAQTYAEFGLIEKDYSLDGFLYHPQGDGRRYHALLRLGGTLMAAISLIALVAAFWNHKLRGAVRRKTRDLKESESRWKSYVEGAPYGIFIMDKKGAVLDVNPAACLLAGYAREELKTLFLQDLLAPESVNDGSRHLEAVARDGFTEGELLFRSKNGDVSWWSLAARGIGADQVIAFCDDLTEQKRTTEMLIHAQKMDSIGQLAGGVAHDFNNMLAVILGNTEMAMEAVPSGQSPYAELKEIQKAAERSAALTRQLLGFARKQTVVRRVLDLNETIEGMLKMLRRLIGEQIELVWRPGAGLGPIKMDPSQIDQILVNLCVNARDAVREGGRITLATGQASLPENNNVQTVGGAPGEYLWLSVEDNGCGMESSLLPHIFEPFFTTKEIGQGTGLGLATVYGIVKQNSGFIGVESEVGKGTIFTMFIPRHKAEAEPVPKPASAPARAPAHETILLVEDESAILQMVRSLLEKRGYRVLAAGTPLEALRVAEAQPGSIDLLVTDVIMPEMDGNRLFRKMSETRPGLRCLFMSGHTDEALAQRGILDAGVHFIQKPFTMQDMEARVQETLQAGSATG